MGKVKERYALGWTDPRGVLSQDYAEAINALQSIGTMTVFNPNTNPVYSMPLSELVNLWRAKYQDTWVDVSEIEEPFWVDASSRLHQNKKMEEISRIDSNTPWARLREEE